MAEFGSRWSRETRQAQEESDRALSGMPQGRRERDAIAPSTAKAEGQLLAQPERDLTAIHCPMCDSGLVLSDEEMLAVADLSQRLELSPAAVWRQALRTYQLHVLGEPKLPLRHKCELPLSASQESVKACCGWDVRREYIVRDPDTLECPNCGQLYTRVLTAAA